MPKEIAEKNGVNINTVRAQLASIYDKTGTTGQSDLSRLMTRLGGVSVCLSEGLQARQPTEAADAEVPT